MSDNCMTCGGLILRPGIVYGYAGPTCYCQIPNRGSGLDNLGSVQITYTPNTLDKILEILERIEKKLNEVR